MEARPDHGTNKVLGVSIYLTKLERSIERLKLSLTSCRVSWSQSHGAKEKSIRAQRCLLSSKVGSPGRI